MDLSFIERAILAYLQKHPEVLEKLIERLVEYLLSRLLDGK